MRAPPAVRGLPPGLGLPLARLLRTDRQWGAVNLLLAGLLVASIAASIVLIWI
ncbi:hypothetical protein GCM10009574_095480 [Streptomyces asiaticus]|uniref:ABC transporter permease n=2 Tax=Streptomyces rhizosphaericus TaxID=114699 RepID=A0ABP4BW13_9ACTN